MILEPGAWAKYPLIDVMDKVPVPIGFIYGDSDWMSRTPADQLINDGVLKEGSKAYTVEGAGHQLFFDNPVRCCEVVVDYAFGSEESKKLDELIEKENMAKIETFKKEMERDGEEVAAQ